MEQVLDDTEYDRVGTGTDTERVSVSSSIRDPDTE